jgi:hypothetical protein
MTKKILYLVLVVGVILRLVFQFVSPAFNADEISLGNNIKHLSFIELLYPLNDYQSAPPLYLWLQKLIVVSLPFSFWIKIKLLNVFSSIVGLLFFYRFLTKEEHYRNITVFLLSIFVFNPFIIYNALNVKQYGFDLLGILLLLYLYKGSSFKKYSWIFFSIWCLISNVGLFGCAGYLLFMFIENQKSYTFQGLFNFVKSHFKTFLAPFPYIIYFLWYLRQEGATELKEFMYVFWKDNFIPLNADIFEFTLYFCHEIWMFFYSAFEFWGIFLVVLLIPLLIKTIKKESYLFKTEILLLLCVFSIHLVLNILGQYPLSDRSFLYLAPLFILMLGSSLDIILNHQALVKNSFRIIFVLTLITNGLYFFYLPFKNNNVVALYKKVNQLGLHTQIYLTPKAFTRIKSFNDFTDHKFHCNCSFTILDTELNNANYIVSKVHTKINPNKVSKEENIIQHYLDDKKIKLIGKVSGYNLYVVDANLR